MSNQKKLANSVIAAIAAVLVSSVAVGSAVGPAQAVVGPTASIGSTLNA